MGAAISKVRRVRTGVAADRRLLVAISLHHATNDGSLVLLGALFPVLIDAFSLSLSEIGALGLAIFATLVLQLLIGAASDRLASRYLLEAGAVLMGLSLLAVTVVERYEGLFLAVIGLRVGGSFYHPVGIGWVSREFAGPGVDRAMGIQSGFGNFGVIAAFLSAAPLYALGGDWRLPFYVWAGVNFAAVAVGFLVSTGIGATLRAPPARSKPRPVQLTQTWAVLRPLIVYSAALGIAGGSYAIITTFGPILLTASLGVPLIWADGLLALWIGLGTATSAVFGLISARIGRRGALQMGFLASAVSGGALWAGGLIGGVGGLALVTAMILISGLTHFLIYPAFFSVISSETDKARQGAIFGFVFSAQLGGGALMVYAGGLLADALGGEAAWPFFFIGLLSALASLLLIGRPRGPEPVLQRVVVHPH